MITSDSGTFDTVDKVCMAAIFCLFVIAFLLKAYERNE